MSYWSFVFRRDDPFSYRSRPFKEENWRQMFGDAVDELITVFVKSGEPPSETPFGHRDVLARSAIGAWGNVGAIGAQWALNHIAGRIRAGVPAYGMIPPHTHREDPTFKREAALANDPGHEATGAAYQFDDPIINRKIMAEFLTVFAGGHPLFDRMARALNALEYGERDPMFAPAKKRVRGLRLWRHKRQALAHVYFRYGAGLRKEVAGNEVARAYDCPEETIASWEQRGPGVFGASDFKYPLFLAFAAGERSRRKRPNSSADNMLTDEERRVVDGMMALLPNRDPNDFSDERLIEDALAFKAMQPKKPTRKRTRA